MLTKAYMYMYMYMHTSCISNNTLKSSNKIQVKASNVCMTTHTCKVVSSNILPPHTHTHATALRYTHTGGDTTELLASVAGQPLCLSSEGGESAAEALGGGAGCSEGEGERGAAAEGVPAQDEPTEQGGL